MGSYCVSIYLFMKLTKFRLPICVRTPLFHAAAFGHEEAVMMLLRAGANRFAVDNLFRTSFAVAAAEGKMLIAALIEADPFSVHIHDMCEQGRLLMVTALLKQVRAMFDYHQLLFS